jgi:copper chaperone
MKTIRLHIEGMTCGHCILSVRKALAKIPGATVRSTEVGTAVVAIDEAVTAEQDLVEAVGDAGYTVVEITELAAG